MTKTQAWESPAQTPTDYHCVETRRGREFILRLTTGADPNLAIARFAVEQNIRFGKVHATFMGAFKPLKYLVWAPDPRDPENRYQKI